MNADIFQGRRVLVTGHTGFKGSWLCIWLHQLGAIVHGFSLPPIGNHCLFNEARIEELLASHTQGDIRDIAAIGNCIHDCRPEIVFHLAAQPLVRKSYSEPAATWNANVMGTVNLLEAVRSNPGVRVCQIITSDKCYSNNGQVCAFRETDPMGGHDPYSSSKGAAELAVDSWRSSFFHPQHMGAHGVSVSSVRAGNVIGGGDWAEDRIIPDCIRALSSGKPIPVRNPASIRPWQHVLEPLSGYLALASRQWSEPVDFADSFNFGPFPSCNVTVGHVAETVVRIWGEGRWENTSTDSKSKARLQEALFLKLDITKATTLLDWLPVLTTEEAIFETVNWYRQRYVQGSRFDARAECLKQISTYRLKQATSKVGQ